MINETLFDDGRRRWEFFGRDPGKDPAVIDTNEYVVSHAGKSMLLDPGGSEVFPPVVAAIGQHIDMDDVEIIFGSHQDPDILSSLPLWTGVCPNAVVYVPAIWTGFIAHFDMSAQIRPIPDEGARLEFNGSHDLTFVPAHYLHSSANFCVYDPTARILFSGDIGSALLPSDASSVTVRDFSTHIRYMEGFHRRWMPSNRAKHDWVERVRHLQIDLMCPQHGAVFAGDDVRRFLEWFDGLTVGAAVA